MDTDQRRIPLTPASARNGTFELQVPRDPGKVVPGSYLLFALTAAGTPSVAKMVMIT